MISRRRRRRRRSRKRKEEQFEADVLYVCERGWTEGIS
jgi:hypothetical protein